MSPRKPEPDEENDAIFDLEIEGDFRAIILWDNTSSFSATTTSSDLAPPVERTAPVPLPVPKSRTLPPAPFVATKHYPVLFAFEDDTLVARDGIYLALSERTGRRKLRLHSWSPPGSRAMRVFAELPDGTYKEGPALR